MSMLVVGGVSKYLLPERCGVGVGEDEVVENKSLPLPPFVFSTHAFSAVAVLDNGFRFVHGVCLPLHDPLLCTRHT